jgi:hypothetical protein
MVYEISYRLDKDLLNKYPKRGLEQNMPSVAVAQKPAALRRGKRCQECNDLLDPESPDDFDNLICTGCQPARRAGNVEALPGVDWQSPRKPAREFTPADKSLIKSVHRNMANEKLLERLNERLLADLGPGASPYTPEQLLREIASLPGADDLARDFSMLRRLLNVARADGTLDEITPQTVDDFAVVFSLNERQLQHLKEVLFAGEGE